MIKTPPGSEKFRKKIAHSTIEIFVLFIGYSPKFVKQIKALKVIHR